MARYQNTLKMTKDYPVYEKAISDLLESKGFAPVDYNGTPMWKKGMGVLAGPQFVGFHQEGQTIVLEGFIRFALLPGVFIGEMGTEGIVGIVPKRQLKKLLTAVEDLIISR